MKDDIKQDGYFKIKSDSKDCECKNFKGKLKKIKIISNSLSFEPKSYPQEEIEQHITINNSGRVWLSGYRFCNGRYERTRSKNFKIERTKVDPLFAIFAYYFGKYQMEIFTEDVGIWRVELTDTKGDTYLFKGSLNIKLNCDGIDLSEIVRETLRMNDLLLFDRACEERNCINRISIEYYRFAGKNYEKECDRETQNLLPFQYSEHFSIDRVSKSVTHIQIIGNGCKISHKYEYGIEMEKLFKNFYQNKLFSYVEGNPADVVENLDESRKYNITIDFKDSPPYFISGSFDKKGLPADFPYFIKNLFEFTATYPIGEIFNPFFYEKVRRCSSEYIYCSVEFEGGYKSYYYLTDDSIEVGDLVVVPVRSDNHEVTVEVVDVEYFTKDKVPFPIEKIKTIIRKY